MKTYVSYLFILTAFLATGAGASELNRFPGSASAVKDYFQIQSENPTACPLATKQAKTPWELSGTCTTLSCPDITASRRSFNFNGDKAR
jgi:hypothetical protein